LEPGGASRILKGVIEEWAHLKLIEPLVLSISEPGDKIYLADAKRLAALQIEINPSKLLPDALIVDAQADPLQLWFIEAVYTDGEINSTRKSEFIKWAAEQGIDAQHCQFLTAFTSRNSAPARRRLKDLAEGTLAWFLDEPELELSWSEIAPGAAVQLAIVTSILS
jgi:hypothetical protein